MHNAQGNTLESEQTGWPKALMFHLALCLFPRCALLVGLSPLCSSRVRRWKLNVNIELVFYFFIFFCQSRTLSCSLWSRRQESGCIRSMPVVPTAFSKKPYWSSQGGLFNTEQRWNATFCSMNEDLPARGAHDPMRRAAVVCCGRTASRFNSQLHFVNSRVGRQKWSRAK